MVIHQDDGQRWRLARIEDANKSFFVEYELLGTFVIYGDHKGMRGGGAGCRGNKTPARIRRALRAGDSDLEFQG